MADEYAPIIYKSLRAHYFNVRVDPTSKRVEEPGRADATATRNGRSVFIEVKCAQANDENSFDFDEYRENQREWAEEYCLNEPYNNPLFVALTIGGDKPHLSPEKGYKPRKLYLLPYRHFQKLEEKIRVYQDSIPYLADKGHNKEMQERNLDAVHLLANYELPYSPKDHIYILPEHHLFNRYFE